MRPRDWFGVAVRSIGVWLLAQAVIDGLLAVWKFNGGATSGTIPAGEDVGFALSYLVAGILGVFFADPITWLLYGMPPKSAPVEPPEPERAE